MMWNNGAQNASISWQLYLQANREQHNEQKMDDAQTTGDNTDICNKIQIHNFIIDAVFI